MSSWVGTELFPIHKSRFDARDIKVIDFLIDYILISGSRHFVCRNPEFFPTLEKLRSLESLFGCPPSSKLCYCELIPLAEEIISRTSPVTSQILEYYLRFNLSFVQRVTGLPINVIKKSDNQYTKWFKDGKKNTGLSEYF